jgi:hypothetical protein
MGECAMANTPWEVDSRLTKDRLEVIADALISVRTDVLEVIDAEKGDSRWVLGCMHYERVRFRLGRMQLEHSWLVAITPGNLEFTVRIDGRPIHIFRGSSLDPDSKQIQRGQTKKEEALELFPGLFDDDGWADFLVLEDDFEGNPLEVSYFQATGAGDICNHYTVRDNLSVSGPVGTVAPSHEGTDLGAPVVSPIVAAAAALNSDDDGGQ